MKYFLEQHIWLAHCFFWHWSGRGEVEKYVFWNLKQRLLHTADHLVLDVELESEERLQSRACLSALRLHWVPGCFLGVSKFFGKKKPTIKNWNLQLTYKSCAKSVFISRRRTIYLLVFSLYTLLLFLKMMNAHNEIPASRHHHGFETFRTF